MSIEKKPGKLVQKIVLSTLRLYFRSRSRITIERNDTLNMKPPYIILANHVTNWDPLLINSYVNEPICFVAGDTLFRQPILKKLLNYAGAIPKTKFKNDSGTIRALLKAKKHDRVMGIFPEGNRNWDGSTEPLVFATAKLVKSLNIPVVIAKIKGGYLSQPRWADSYRKGPISISLEKLWDSGEMTNETPEAIHQQLSQALCHEEVKWQQQTRASYKGKALAERLERLLFICPHCKTLGSLRSKQDRLSCLKCNYEVIYTKSGKFEAAKQPLIYSTPRAWNLWQLAYMEKTYQELKFFNNHQSTLKDTVKLYISEGYSPFKLISQGTLQWSDDALLFTGANETVQTYSFNQLEGLNIHLNNNLDFHQGNSVIRIKFYQPHTSAYKWIKAIQIALKVKKDQSENAGLFEEVRGESV